MLGRPDLYPHCDNKDVDSLNKEFSMNSWCMPNVRRREVIYRKVPKLDCGEEDIQLPGVLKMIFDA